MKLEIEHVDLDVISELGVLNNDVRSFGALLTFDLEKFNKIDKGLTAYELKQLIEQYLTTKKVCIGLKCHISLFRFEPGVGLQIVKGDDVLFEKGSIRFS